MGTQRWGRGGLWDLANPFPSGGFRPCKVAFVKGRMEPAPGVNQECVYSSVSLLGAEQAWLSELGRGGVCAQPPGSIAACFLCESRCWLLPAAGTLSGCGDIIRLSLWGLGLCGRQGW